MSNGWDYDQCGGSQGSDDDREEDGGLFDSGPVHVAEGLAEELRICHCAWVFQSVCT